MHNLSSTVHNLKMLNSSSNNVFSSWKHFLICLCNLQVSDERIASTFSTKGCINIDNYYAIRFLTRVIFDIIESNADS